MRWALIAVFGLPVSLLGATSAELEEAARAARSTRSAAERFLREHQQVSALDAALANPAASLVDLCAQIKAKRAELKKFPAVTQGEEALRLQMLRDEIGRLRDTTMQIVNDLSDEGTAEIRREHLAESKAEYVRNRKKLKEVPDDLKALIEKADTAVNGAVRQDNAERKPDEPKAETPDPKKGEAEARKKAADEERRKLLEQNKEQK